MRIKDVEFRSMRIVQSLCGDARTKGEGEPQRATS